MFARAIVREKTHSKKVRSYPSGQSDTILEPTGIGHYGCMHPRLCTAHARGELVPYCKPKSGGCRLYSPNPWSRNCTEGTITARVNWKDSKSIPELGARNVLNIGDPLTY